MYPAERIYFFLCKRKNSWRINRIISSLLFEYVNKRVARNIVEGHLQYRSRSIVTHIKKEKKKERFKEREYNIEIFIVKKVHSRMERIFFLYQVPVFIILYYISWGSLFFERVNPEFKRTQNEDLFYTFLFLFYK